ncbi:MAG: CBS domain-containing protein [Desulfobacterales bacterium]
MSLDNLRECAPVDISDDDVMEAMKSIKGYIDITPADFREVYRVAYVLARQRMMNALKAADIMTTPVHVVHIGTDLVETATLLAEKGISGAPVIDENGNVIGVISEKDFLRRMGAGQKGSFMNVIAHCLKNKGCVATPIINRSVGDIMTVPAVTARVDISIGSISAMMIEKNINRIPIVDAEEPLRLLRSSEEIPSISWATCMC